MEQDTESSESIGSHHLNNEPNPVDCKSSTEPEKIRTTASSTNNSDTSCNTVASNKSYGVKLLRFFVYNPNFGPKEGQEAKKIIYFYDSDQHRDTTSLSHDHNQVESAIKHVGLTEAAIRFAAVFSNSDHCALGMHTQKTKSVYLEPEKNFFMVLTVTVPRTKRRKLSRSAESSTSPTYEYAYSPDDVHENVLRAIVLRAYDMFKMFCGGFQYQLKTNCDNNVEEFKQNVESFYRRYVKSSMMSVVDKADLGCSLFGGVQFLTLQSSAFLKVQNFIGRIEDEFRPNIEASLFLHQGNIVWSGLQQKETTLLFQYINNSLLPATVFASSSGSISSPSNETPSRNPFSGHQGRFLTGINSQGAAPDIKIPKLFLSPPSPLNTEEYVTESEASFREYHLIVYHAITSTVCLIIPSEIEITNGMIDRLDANMGCRLTNMSADLLDVFGRGNIHLNKSSSNPSLACTQLSPVAQQGALEQNLKDLGFSNSGSTGASGTADSTSNANVRFIYYNGTNKAMKNTLFSGNGKTMTNYIPSWSAISLSSAEVQSQDINMTALRDELHVVADMKNYFERIAERW